MHKKSAFAVLLMGKVLLLEMSCDKFLSKIRSAVNTASWLGGDCGHKVTCTKCRSWKKSFL